MISCTCVRVRTTHPPLFSFSFLSCVYRRAIKWLQRREEDEGRREGRGQSSRIRDKSLWKESCNQDRNQDQIGPPGKRRRRCEGSLETRERTSKREMLAHASQSVSQSERILPSFLPSLPPMSYFPCQQRKGGGGEATLHIINTLPLSLSDDQRMGSLGESRYYICSTSKAVQFYIRNPASYGS